MDEETPQSTQITELLQAWGTGDPAALERVFDELYPSLREVAARAMRGERPDHTLQPTAIVHEAYLELSGQARAQFRDRAHFLAVAGFVMRRILVEHARARAAAKRGGGASRQALADDAEASAPATALEEILAVDLALERLAAIDERAARAVTLRYFGGLSLEETAVALGVSLATAKRDWTVARAWLRRELGAP